jgi:hypothetical protein
MLGRGGGEIAICPVAWVTRAAKYPGEFLASLGRLLELRVEKILVSHGQVLSAHAALERAVTEARSR